MSGTRAVQEIERFVSTKLRPNTNTFIQLANGRGVYFLEYSSFAEMRHCKSLRYIFMPPERACEVTRTLLPQLKEMVDIYIPSLIVLVVIQVKLSGNRDIGNAVALEILTTDNVPHGDTLPMEPFVSGHHCVAEHCTASNVRMKICDACQDARYCSRACQTSDYQARHKNECDEIRQIKAKVKSHAKHLGRGNVEFMSGKDAGTRTHVL